MGNDFDPKKDGASSRGDSDTGEKQRKPVEGERQPFQFRKDKRPRITRDGNTRQDGRRQPDRGNAPLADDERRNKPFDGERRSYNPNFSKDNRLRSSGTDKRREGAQGGGWKERKFDTSAGAGGYKGKGDGKASGGYGQKRSYGDKPYKSGSDKRFGNKERKEYAYPKGGFDSGSRPATYPSFNPEPVNEPVRLNKYISKSGLCSRREADEFIAKGLVSVNGRVVTEMGVKVSPGDKVEYNGNLLQGEKVVYILMNKPKGFVTTVEDPNAERTVMEIVQNACKERVYPVGRLDKNSLGVLLITNDGELTKKLTHPSHAKKKIYEVALDKAITKADMEKLLEGIELEDGMAVADEVEYVDDSKKNIGVAIHSGRNRVVRRMFESMGYRVNKLDRVYFAGLTKKGLQRGAWRYLSVKEIGMLKSGKYE